MPYDGRKYLSFPYHQAPFLSETFKNEHFISLYRVYFNNFREKMGIVEVVQNYHVIFGGLKTIMDTASRRGRRVIIFNQEGEPIYPLDFSEDYTHYFQKIIPMLAEEKREVLFLRNPVTREREIITYAHSEYTDWTTLLVQPTRNIMLSAVQFTRLTLSITLVSLCFALWFSSLIARKLTQPIHKIHQLICNTNLTNLGENNPLALGNAVNELEELNQAFHQMSLKMKKAIIPSQL